jgi:hypothetical protein
MSDLDPDSAPDDSDNARAYSVSELSFALKRTLEDRYGFVRLKGELSKVTHHSNGHVYLSLKDERAVIDGVVWKGSVRNLSVRPEQGLEVIVTGKITTYPQGSRYQIVIESMTAAGAGALLAQLERLKARLAAEGLFEASRKQPLPALPCPLACPHLAHQRSGVRRQGFGGCRGHQQAAARHVPQHNRHRQRQRAAEQPGGGGRDAGDARHNCRDVHAHQGPNQPVPGAELVWLRAVQGVWLHWPGCAFGCGLGGPWKRMLIIPDERRLQTMFSPCRTLSWA